MVVLIFFLFSVPAVYGGAGYDTNPPFGFDQLQSKTLKTGGFFGKRVQVYEPKNPFNIFINYELGMHCVGFNMTYCCIIPPYNSIQAQAVQSESGDNPPRLLSPEDHVKLSYSVKDNSYSEGNKMSYWGVPKDVNGNARMDDPGDNIANYVWTHLFIYKDLEGTIPEDWSPKQRLHVGKEIQVPVDSGPSGKHMSGGYMDYAGKDGGNVVFTDTLIPAVQNVPLKLTASYVWDALGLPLTAFNDSRLTKAMRTITNHDFQPYQYSVAQLHDDTGKPMEVNGQVVEFFGTNPVDIPNCYACHSGEGPAAIRARKAGLTHFDEEYQYRKSHYPDISDYMARFSQAAINILELHDKAHGTQFLKEYNKDASTHRLGSVGPVNCTDCHGDNISGNLQEPRPNVTGYKAVKAPPLTEAIHATHLAVIPMGDKAGRTQSCQACHPTHWQDEKMNDFATNSYQIIDDEGNPRFSEDDQRSAGGGCYLRRDAHANPDAQPPFFLNDIGRWYLDNVSRKDAEGKTIRERRGLTCTNCHNQLTQDLYVADNLTDVVSQTGKTLRNRSINEVIEAVAGGDAAKFRDIYADPKVNAEGNPLVGFYRNHTGATLVKASKDAAGNLKLAPWNAAEGDAVPYDGASAGKDWWLAASEPHCANCHAAPFVESEGGPYFPVDQPDEYSRYP